MACKSEDGIIYVTANEAVEYLAPHLGGKYQARTAIADAMHNGDLITTADSVWVLTDTDPTEDWADIIKGAEAWATDVELPSNYWHGSYQWPSETRHWRWKEGNFLLNRSDTLLDAFTGDALVNVQFDQREVELLIGRSSRAGVGGRKFDKDKWAEFWINVIYETSAKHFEWDKFPSKNALKNFISDRCNEDMFADSSVAFAVDLAWEGLVKRAERERETWAPVSSRE